MNGTLDGSFPSLVVTAVTASAISGTDTNSILMAFVVTGHEAPRTEDGSCVVSAGAAVVASLTSLEDMTTGVTSCICRIFSVLLYPLSILQLVGIWKSIRKE